MKFNKNKYNAYIFTFIASGVFRNSCKTNEIVIHGK